jgi:hypothetical protein
MHSSDLRTYATWRYIIFEKLADFVAELMCSENVRSPMKWPRGKSQDWWRHSRAKATRLDWICSRHSIRGCARHVHNNRHSGERKITAHLRRPRPRPSDPPLNRPTPRRATPLPIDPTTIIPGCPISKFPSTQLG